MFDSEGDRIIEIYAADGRLTKNKIFSSALSLDIDVENLPNGVYYLKIQEKSVVSTIKVVVN